MYSHYFQFITTDEFSHLLCFVKSSYCVLKVYILSF